MSWQKLKIRYITFKLHIGRPLHAGDYEDGPWAMVKPIWFGSFSLKSTKEARRCWKHFYDKFCWCFVVQLFWCVLFYSLSGSCLHGTRIIKQFCHNLLISKITMTQDLSTNNELEECKIIAILKTDFLG